VTPPLPTQEEVAAGELALTFNRTLRRAQAAVTHLGALRGARDR
jgi:hypothetical protein